MGLIVSRVKGVSIHSESGGAKRLWTMEQEVQQ